MKERPILFSAPMVRSVLAGNKTQTRRIVKPQPQEVGFGRNCIVRPYCTGTEWPLAYYEMRGSCWNSSNRLTCPHGIPGERLWGKETFYNDIPEEKDPEQIFYRADGKCCEIIPECQCATVGPVKWKPSIFMPRWASRITLEIIGVRVERLQAISAKDIIAEGAVERSHENQYLGKMPVSAFDGKAYPDLRSLWAHGWESINGKGSWEKNPYVWCISFKRV